MIEAGANIVASDGMNGKGFASISRFVGKYFDAGWSERCFVKVEMAMDLRMGRKLWINSRRSKKIKS